MGVGVKLICGVSLAEGVRYPENAKGHGSARTRRGDAKVKHETPIRLAPQEGEGQRQRNEIFRPPAE
jgi:hypothetical protein